MGAVLGLFLAAWGLDLIKALGAHVHPALATARIHPMVIGFTLALSLVTVLLFGLFPAWHAARPDLDRVLRGGAGSRLVVERSRLRDAMLVFEISAALVLLVGAGLTVRSMSRLGQVDPGFVTADKLAMDIWLPWKKYREGTKQVAFFSEAIERVRALPGVIDSGVVSVLPLGSNSDSVGIEVEGKTYLPGRNPSPDRYVVSPGYLASMPIRQVAGRGFDATDRPGSLRVVMVNETLARSVWPEGDPIGKRIRLPTRQSGVGPWRTVIGVVGDVKQHGLDQPNTMQMYLPMSQYPWAYMTLVVRTHADPAVVGGAVRGTLRELDPDIPVFNMNLLEDLRANSMSIRRFTMWLLAGFAGIALALSAVGIYGVFAYSVSCRSREVGLRMALGARRSDILSLILGRGLALTAVGLGLGFVVAWISTRVMTGLLFGVSPTDPLTFAAVGILLATVALAACWVPARRAIKVDPVVTLQGG